MTIESLLIRVAAVWYIAYTVTSSDGPFKVFFRVRQLLPLGGLTACIVCLSIWVGLLVINAPDGWLLQGVGLAGLALWLHRYSGWAYQQ